MSNKSKIVVFLSDETLKALNNKAKIEEQSRSNICSQLIKKAVEPYRPKPNET